MISLQPIALLGFVHIVIIISIVLLYWFQTYKRLIPSGEQILPHIPLLNWWTSLASLYLYPQRVYHYSDRVNNSLA